MSALGERDIRAPDRRAGFDPGCVRVLTQPGPIPEKCRADPSSAVTSVKSQCRSTTNERATALLERTERLRRRNSGAKLCEISRVFGFFRIFYFEEVDIVNLASVLADLTVPEQGIIGPHLL